ncbi:DNA polymerase [Mustelid gammaherpesvirus 1]|uniref:DNA polymerase n=4 Tax=Mustelid gammaherpesvirus 1 TaxID=311179 RepID=Q8JUX1_9GAMA|nr:DNA polymerase [Mustelid gammaherpesvirus 1]AAM62282.1 DNA polymerase [Mustelid gammaherpesvirus 1]
MAGNFYNPYLNPKKFIKTTQESCVENLEEYTRLIPLCFKTPHQPGVTPITHRVPPTFFFNGKEELVFPQRGKSIWKKHSNPPVDKTTRELTFHVYDIIETTYHSQQFPNVPFDIHPSGTVLKLLGRTEDNYSVCVNVFQQKVYFYVADTLGAMHHIQQTLRAQTHGYSIVIMKKKILREYGVGECNVYKVSLTSNKDLNTIIDKLQRAGCELFETNVDAVKRFVIDNGFSTFGWYHCKLAHPRLNNRDSWTDPEFDCSWMQLTFLPERHDWPNNQVLSFDIECLGENGFPNATRDEDMILQISCVLWKTGENTPPRKILFNLGTCDPIPDTEVFECPSEIDMLYLFLTMLRDLNIEFITGYNIANFDFPYIIDRAVQVFNFNLKDFTRIKNSSMFEVHTPQNSSAGFMRAVSKIKISGFVCIDMYNVCKEKLSLSNYKLNTVAKQCIGGQKEDVSYKDIPHLFRAGPAGRAKLGVYCVKDSEIVLQLLRYFMTHIEISEIAKIAKIPTRRVLTDGQQIRVFSCLLDVAKDQNYILPQKDRGDSDGYQGATVIDPIPGFYNTPILVVDFASLYPTIIQANNLCYSTMIPHEKLHIYNISPHDYQTFNLSSGPVHFVKKHKQVSLLATLLDAWLSKRRAIKKTLQSVTDPNLRTILDKQQLAIKVTCNAVYGFTGVSSGILPCLKIAETITYEGRRMLEKSKNFIENITPVELERIIHKPINCAYDANFRVIYGDTDSLFIECQGYPISEVSGFCDQLAKITTEALFEEPIKLEAEKIFQCLIILSKKRYIGILSKGELLMKGVDLIRKTSCKFIQNTSKEVLNLLLHDTEVREAACNLSSKQINSVYSEGLPLPLFKVIDILNDSYKKLKFNTVPIEDLTFTTELSKPASFYKVSTLPHIVVYHKIISRNEEPPQIHDRIPYVFVASPNATLKSDMAEDPAFVQQHNIPLAVDLYFDKVVRGAANILQCVFGNSADKAVSVLYNFLDLPFTVNAYHR